MNTLEILEKVGIEMKRASRTDGGEYAGPCPFCGGNDRFRLWPHFADRKGGKYWCRQCESKGDGIQLVREIERLSYQEACDLLGVPTERKKEHSGRTYTESIHPKNPQIPGEVWMNRAQEFLSYAQKNLRENDTVLGWLTKERGITQKTAVEVGLGWNDRAFHDDGRKWGLSDLGKKRVWIPSGLVIPCFSDNLLVRLRFRLHKPFNDMRYYFCPGGSPMPMYIGKARAVVLVVESELDGILIWQEASFYVDVLALGSAQIRPDIVNHEKLKKADKILVSLDDDEAGWTEYYKFWSEEYGKKAKRWPMPESKDPGEGFKRIGILEWVMSSFISEAK